ncbi:MAG: hypothetical protein Q9220_007687 [cf. Caloplaca sp. 1 TL-2023]
MDSMRSLNKSLPRAPNTTATQPPEQLLQAFKTAALSVTNLYKTAASDQTRARQAGYQEALDDILAFLDKQNLGLGDGEGWRVRQWATERLDGSTAGAMASDSDDEKGETVKRDRSDSPVIQHKSSTEVLSAAQQQQQQQVGSTSPARNISAPPIPQNAVQPALTSTPASTSITTQPEIFSFRSSHPYPHDVDMVISESSTATSGNKSPTSTPLALPPPPPPAAVRVEVRGTRTPHRHASHSNRHNTRGANMMNRRSLGPGAGSKRRFDVNDYFDLGNLGDGKDGTGGGGGGGGKKGRLS